MTKPPFPTRRPVARRRISTAARNTPGSRAAACLAALLLAAVFAAPAVAQLDDIYTEWRQGPAQILMLPAEEKAWEQVSTNQEAEDDIRLFWAKRDPTPGTAENEFRREFEQRAAYANEQFKTEEQIGALTDQGRVFILLGPPRRIQRSGASASSSGGDFGASDSAVGAGGNVASGTGSGVFGRGGASDRMGLASEERWVYEGDEKPDFIKKRRHTVRFLTKPGTDEVELRSGDLALGFMGTAKRQAITQPDLTVADLADMAPAAEVAGGAGDEGEAGGVTVWMGETVDDVSTLRAALEGEAGGAGMHLDSMHLDTGAFQAGDGRWIIPYQVSAEGADGDMASVVGELVDGSGETVAAFRHEQSWTESKSQKIAKDTLVVPPGDYELRVGVEEGDGSVAWAASEKVEVPDVGDDYWLSKLIFSEDVHPMPEAQQMLEPYAWQGIVVVPKGDRTFQQGTVMWFYTHACNPQLTTDGKPNLRVTAKVEGPTAMRDAVPVQPARAGDNCWVIATGLDLVPDRFPEGEYEMTLQVRDSEGGKTLQSKEVFQVEAAGG